MSVSKLARGLRGSPLAKNKYKIYINSPTHDAEKLNILCQSAKFPDWGNNSVTIHHRGVPYHFRGESSYGDTLNVSFLDNSRGDIRKVFAVWADKVNDPDSFNVLSELGNTAAFVNELKGVYDKVQDFKADPMGSLLGAIVGTGPGATYQTDIELWQLDGNGKEVHGYRFEKAFPVSISGSDFSAGSTNEFQTIEVSFKYSKFEYIGKNYISVETLSKGMTSLI